MNFDEPPKANVNRREEEKQWVIRVGSMRTIRRCELRTMDGVRRGGGGGLRKFDNFYETIRLEDLILNSRIKEEGSGFHIYSFSPKIYMEYVAYFSVLNYLKIVEVYQFTFIVRTVQENVEKRRTHRERSPVTTHRNKTSQQVYIMSISSIGDKMSLPLLGVRI